MNNSVTIIGVLEESFHHSFRDRKTNKHFSRTNVMVERNSGSVDCIPIMADDDVRVDTFFRGDRVAITGEIRSRHVGPNKNTERYVYIKNIDFYLGDESDVSSVSITGRLVSKSELKETKIGRKLVECVVGCDRDKYTDFIPVVFWGKNALSIDRYSEITDVVDVTGWIQSRQHLCTDGKVRNIISVNATKVEGVVLYEN